MDEYNLARVQKSLKICSNANKRSHHYKNVLTTENMEHLSNTLESFF